MWTELLDLTDELRRTHNTLVSVIDDLHATTGVPARLRAVLEYLDRHGPTPVPDIARARGVTRQHIQTTVNELLARTLVTHIPNPGHRRSHLVALTDRGADTIEAMQAAEREALEPRLADLDPDRLAESAATLRALRTALVDPEGTHDNEGSP